MSIAMPLLLARLMNQLQTTDIVGRVSASVAPRYPLYVECYKQLHPSSSLYCLDIGASTAQRKNVKAIRKHDGYPYTAFV